MSTAEHLIFSLREESRGVHVLLWDDKEDLVRVLTVLRAGLPDVSMAPLLVSNAPDSTRALLSMVEGRLPPLDHSGDEPEPSPPADPRLWVLFLQQAVGQDVGHWLNGWRRPISEPRGTLFVIRHADYAAFQRTAPDLASYVGPRLFDSSGILLICTGEMAERIETALPEEFADILRSLPGEAPSPEELDGWVRMIRGEGG